MMNLLSAFKSRKVASAQRIRVIALFGFAISLGLISAPANADDKPSDGWESPAKLKPYVKLQADPAPATTPAASPAAVSPEKKAADSKELDNAVKMILSESGPDLGRLRRDRKSAKRLAAYHWLDKAADANPLIIEAITSHRSAAKILAKHPRLSEIADADHYVCRRITQWKGAARVLAKNSEVKEVAEFDPEGLYAAIERDKKIVRILSRNPMFDQMVVENPDLGRVVAKYM